MTQATEQVTDSSGCERTSGQCVGCGSSDYTQVCYRGKPRYGPDGLYCESCFGEANTDIFGEEE